MNAIAQQQLLTHIEHGSLATLGEYRMSKAELISWRDKQNGQARSAPMLRHTVEIGDKSVTVNERVPDTIKLEDIKVPHAKGDSVILIVDEWTTERGIVSCRGKLEKIETAPSPGTTGTSGGSKTR